MRRDVPGLFTKALDRITKEMVAPSLDALNSVSGEASDDKRLLIVAGRYQGLSLARDILNAVLDEADRDDEKNP